MQSPENCGLCGQLLVYGTQEISKRCDFCGKESKALIYCPEGHYVCDACHSRGALDILRDVLSKTTSADPIEILEKVMAHPGVPMHGPEHHVMVPAIIITAVKNAGYPVPEGRRKRPSRGAQKCRAAGAGFTGRAGQV